MAIPKHRLPEWVQDWLDVIVPGSQILGILLVAYLLQRLLRRLVRKAAVRYQLPGQLVVPINGLIRWTIMASALLLSLERLGVSATALMARSNSPTLGHPKFPQAGPPDYDDSGATAMRAAASLRR